MKRDQFRRVATAASIALAASLGSCASPPPPSSRVLKSPENPSAPSRLAEPIHLTDQVVQAHNARRAKAGLSPLTLNRILERSAIEQARDMAARSKMSHKGSDGSSPFDRMKRNGYVFVAAAENVAYGFDDVESVMEGWMKSPGHRRNILGKFTEIGVGRAIAKDGASYWCVTFGTPAGR